MQGCPNHNKTLKYRVVINKTIYQYKVTSLFHIVWTAADFQWEFIFKFYSIHFDRYFTHQYNVRYKAYFNLPEPESSAYIKSTF